MDLPFASVVCAQSSDGEVPALFPRLPAGTGLNALDHVQFDSGEGGRAAACGLSLAYPWARCHCIAEDTMPVSLFAKRCFHSV